MSSLALPHPSRSRVRAALVVLAVWFAAALSAGLAGLFAPREPVRPPVELGLAALGPVLAFLVALVTAPAARRFVRSLDLKVLTLAQSWRIAGAVFLALWANGKLPAGFALPAGIGDVLVGVTAPLVAFGVVPRLPARLPLYVAWTAFGVLDLIVAVSLGVLHSGTLGGPTGPITTAVMGTVPLSLIPTFFVPLTMILHVAAAYRVLARPASSGSNASAGAPPSVQERARRVGVAAASERPG